MENLVTGLILLVIGPISLYRYYQIKKKYYPGKEQPDAGTNRLFWGGSGLSIIGLILVLEYLITLIT